MTITSGTRAHDSRLGRDVAIKFSTERFSERFEREACKLPGKNGHKRRKNPEAFVEQIRAFLFFRKIFRASNIPLLGVLHNETGNNEISDQP